MVTTDPEPRLAALLRERELASTGDASAALDALLACSSQWPTSRLLYECVAAAAEIAAANQVALYAFDGVVRALRCAGTQTSGVTAVA